MAAVDLPTFKVAHKYAGFNLGDLIGEFLDADPITKDPQEIKADLEAY